MFYNKQWDVDADGGRPYLTLLLDHLSLGSLVGYNRLYESGLRIQRRSQTVADQMFLDHMSL